jgi:hypothetical protein
MMDSLGSKSPPSKGKVVAYNAAAVAALAALVVLPMLHEVQAAASWLAYYASTPYAKLPMSLVRVEVAAVDEKGAQVPVRELAVVWLASPLNNFTSQLVHRGSSGVALLSLPRAHLGRVVQVDAYNRVRWADLYNVENLLLMVVGEDGSFGAAVAGVELSDVAVSLKVEVRLTSKIASAAAGFAQSSTWYRLAEYQEFERVSAFSILYPDAGVKIVQTIPSGMTLWFESKSRSAPDYYTLPQAQWSSGFSGVNSPVTMTFDSSVPAPSGGVWVKLGTKVRWRYERWERYDSGVLTQVIEAVFPSACLGGIYYIETGSYTPPPVGGNVQPIGDPGACVQFNIGGAWEIGGVSVALGFSVSYPAGNVSIGVSLGFTIRYVGATVTVCVVSAAKNPSQYSVVAFDRGTNWGRVYTAWVPD